MIKLKNVSKFYYSKGVIATGFTKVSLEFKTGEFVAITGESGSGKSTLLNVISGLDTYEEGEMYINGLETSHYLEKEWEDYRRKYIGNIYQNFNLINSYTVYQNIELVLLLNGVSKRDAKPKVLELIKKVDLTRFKNTKVSKLSGGQKQRVAIARALAKDVPIIIADEPTGNLDKKSAEGVIKLLNELRKDKLVIIVTHNYEQVEEYVTRKITMHDGKVLEDKHLRESEEGKVCENNYSNISFFNRIKLGIRNTFNVTAKFILLFLVYLFIVSALMTEYSSFKRSEYENGNSGFNYVFNDISINRIVARKEDRSVISLEELEKIKKLDNVSSVMKNDALVDRNVYMVATDNSYTIDGSPMSMEQFQGTVDVGRMPTSPNEVIILGGASDYYLKNEYKSMLERTYRFETAELTSNIFDDIKIAGIKYLDDTDSYQPYRLCFSTEMIDKLQYQVNQRYSETTVTFLGKMHTSDTYDIYYKLTPSDSVPKGNAYISEDFKYSCPKENCVGQGISIKVSNMYYEDFLSLNVSGYYNKKNLKDIARLVDYKDEDYTNLYNGRIYINSEDFNSLYNKGTYQISLYVKDPKLLDEVKSSMKDLGFKTLAIRDVLKSDTSAYVRVAKIIVTVFLVVTLFFITYFIIKLILKSRNIYFTTVRMLGAPKKVARQLLIIELFIVTNISYIFFMILLYLNSIKVIKVSALTTITSFFALSDYVLIYLIIIILSLLISEKYAAKIFKKSVMNSYREEV